MHHIELLSFRRNGFTLIELVVVIVILGVLSVTALPKIINIGTNAKIGVLNGIKSGLNTGVSLIEKKAIVNGLYNNKGVGVRGTTLEFNGLIFTIYNQGVPREIWMNGFNQLIDGDFNYLGSGSNHINTKCIGNNICVIDNLKVSTTVEGQEGYGIFFFLNGDTLAENDCFTYYAFHINTSAALEYKEVNSVITGC
jgi:prepilin-type N-terminal cleavage/methylation domain-containing protein